MQGHGRIIAPDFCVAHREANSGLSTLNRTKSILSICNQQRQLQKQRGMCLNDTYPFCQQPLSDNCHSICFLKPVLWTATPRAFFFCAENLCCRLVGRGPCAPPGQMRCSAAGHMGPALQKEGRRGRRPLQWDGGCTGKYWNRGGGSRPFLHFRAGGTHLAAMSAEKRKKLVYCAMTNGGGTRRKTQKESNTTRRAILCGRSGWSAWPWHCCWR